MDTTTHTTYEIRDRKGNWHPLAVALFYVATRGYVPTYYVPGRDDVALEQPTLERLIDEGTVRAARVDIAPTVEPPTMEPYQARALINHEGRDHTLVIRFTKADGTRRRMVCRYAGTPSRSRYHMVVWDLERGAWRQVDTRTCTEIKVLSSTNARRAA